MSRLRFWHPVLCVETLPKDRPVGIRVAGRDLAVFRTPGGGLGELPQPSRGLQPPETSKWRNALQLRPTLYELL